ncbi:Uncharacterized protein TCM_002276 [Theobroma cacao]|uniref:F-box associated beta-propeller type 3 domain-containing protein n=1 Tax=Theobroma cacao TaxID=3641 RepID=A0A061DLV1_THECC|nr:Uncharacterized protein TCM_002276 [Theobroma cacao]
MVLTSSSFSLQQDWILAVVKILLLLCVLFSLQQEWVLATAKIFLPGQFVAAALILPPPCSPPLSHQVQRDHPSHTIQPPCNIFVAVNVGLPSLAKLNTISASNFSDDGEGKVILKKLPNFPMPMYLLDSCNGLLCMHDSRGIYICNPFTGLYVELPKLVNYPAKVEHIGFSFHQTTNEYKVVRIVFRRQLSRRGGTNVASSTLIQSQVHVLIVGDPAWRNLGMIPYNFTRPTPNATEVPKRDCCGLDRCLHNLMVLRGCLSASASHGNKQLEDVLEIDSIHMVGKAVLERRQETTED